MIATCPHCKHTFDTESPKKGKRICCECQKPILRHDKWFFNPDSKVQHRHCDNPEEYRAAPIDNNANTF